MADEYIRRDFALAGTELYKYCEMEIEAVSAEHIQRIPAADVAPVVRNLETAGIHGKKVFCHRRIHSIFATTGRQNERVAV